jgi:hypothetical protein
VEAVTDVGECFDTFKGRESLLSKSELAPSTHAKPLRVFSLAAHTKKASSTSRERRYSIDFNDI